MLNEWQPIETAPKDKTKILIWAFGEHHIVNWAGWKWGWFDGDSVLDPEEVHYWMPLPKPPEDNDVA